MFHKLDLLWKLKGTYYRVNGSIYYSNEFQYIVIIVSEINIILIYIRILSYLMVYSNQKLCNRFFYRIKFRSLKLILYANIISCKNGKFMTTTILNIHLHHKNI
jgi:hypothetical protein